MKHFFKNPRYRICFQTKSKVWIYKNSRLRNFYKIRHKIVLKSGKFAKNFLITKNMKWTVARRQMVPYFRIRNRFDFFYKNLFFTKQQLKNFYGGLKEYQIRNIFKNTWNKEHVFRTNVFIGALEQRLSMLLFRMKVLPTIFTCNQLIKHQGIFVNDKKVTLANFRVKIGDIISISEVQWFMFYKHIFERLYHRVFAEGLLLWRKHYIINRIRFYRIKKKYKYIVNLRLLKKFNVQKKRYLNLKKYIYFFFKKLKNSTNSLHKNLKLNSLKLLNFFLHIKLFKKLKKIQKNLHLLRKWSKKTYYNTVNKLLCSIYYIKNFINKFLYVFDKVLVSWVLQEIKELFKYQEKINDKTYPEILNIFFKNILYKQQKIEKKEIFFDKKIKKYVERQYKKTLLFKPKSIRYKKYFLFLLRKLKFRKKKKKNI